MILLDSTQASKPSLATDLAKPNLPPDDAVLIDFLCIRNCSGKSASLLSQSARNPVKLTEFRSDAAEDLAMQQGDPSVFARTPLSPSLCETRKAVVGGESLLHCDVGEC
jgi:hypothetical protein